MREKFGWIALVFFFFTLVPSLAVAQEEPQEKDPLVKMMEEGWRPVAPGVLQRSSEDDKVETFAVGPEGLKWTIGQLQSRLAYLRKEYRSYPSADLQKAIASYRKQIARFQKELRAAKAESLESALAKAGCSVSYSSYANATWLTNAAGVTSNSSASFNNTCGYSAEVYAEAYARATKNGVTDTWTQTDGPRYGAVISASATSTIQGNTNCDSSSYSYARFSGANIFLTFNAANSACPTPAKPQPTISGTTWEYFSYNTCVSRTWTVTVSNGASPYSYQWYINGTAMTGNGSSYSGVVCSGYAPGFNVSVTVTDSAGQQGSDTHWVAVEYYQEQPMCGDYIC